MAGGVKVSVAFSDPTFTWTPTWTEITQHGSLVASYEINRGRKFEFDRTDTGNARISINDRDGILDPTNTGGPYYGLIEPLLQIKIELYNPVAGAWSTRFRGFIAEYDYTPDPSTYLNRAGKATGVMRLELDCVGIFAPLTAIEMQPDGSFGDSVTNGNIFFEGSADVSTRIDQVMGNALIPAGFYVAFTGNVALQGSVYSPSENVLQVLQDAADAEMPTVSNLYEDRLGRMVFHGRLAKFDPATVAADAGSAAWDFQHWKCGDGAAVAASVSDTAHVRGLSWSRGWSKVYNSAFCTPNGISGTDKAGQYWSDATSIGQYGYRSWSAENLLVDSGVLTGNTAKDECLLFAKYIVANYKQPRDRVTSLAFRSMRPTDSRAAANWALLCGADISDLIDVTVAFPGDASGTGGFVAEPFFIEGVTETVAPATDEYADVTLTLDVSPRAYFDDPAGLDGV